MRPTASLARRARSRVRSQGGGRVRYRRWRCASATSRPASRGGALALAVGGGGRAGRRLRAARRRAATAVGCRRWPGRPGHRAARPRHLAPGGVGRRPAAQGRARSRRTSASCSCTTARRPTPTRRPRSRRPCATSTRSTPARPRAGRTSATTSSSTATAASGRPARGASTGRSMASATGGSQGFAQLVCLLGDFTDVLPTPAALSVADARCWPGSAASTASTPARAPPPRFVSRGSQRWAPGVTVTTTHDRRPPGHELHRLPGDQLYPVVRNQLPAQVTAQRQQCGRRRRPRTAARTTRPCG